MTMDTLGLIPAPAAVHARPGLFYGWQTLRQILAAADAAGVVPCTRIEDRPRFPWRGLMLDPARHFLPVPFLKRSVDLQAGYKFNRLHLHLTDDLGWTLESRRYPELADMARWAMTPPDRRRGVYTQAEMRERAAYAAARHVTLVPKIEMPGHNGVPGWLLRDRVLCPNNPWRDARRRGTAGGAGGCRRLLASVGAGRDRLVRDAPRRLGRIRGARGASTGEKSEDNDQETDAEDTFHNGCQRTRAAAHATRRGVCPRRRGRRRARQAARNG
jgi:hypothetical protein